MSRLGCPVRDRLARGEPVARQCDRFRAAVNRAGVAGGNDLIAQGGQGVTPHRARITASFIPAHERGDVSTAAIMEEIRGPAGRTMWEKLGNVNEEILANFLQKEYPQTVAVVMSKIQTEHAARVLALLPENFALEVIHRMLRMEAVQKEVLEDVERTLRTEFMSNLARTQRRDSHEILHDQDADGQHPRAGVRVVEPHRRSAHREEQRHRADDRPGAGVGDVIFFGRRRRVRGRCVGHKRLPI